MSELQKSTLGQGEIDLKSLPSLPLYERHNLPSGSALYFVRNGDDVLYIGGTLALRKRWRRHKQLIRLPATSVITWIEMSAEQIPVAEALAVERFTPILNKQRPCADLRAGLIRTQVSDEATICKCRLCKYQWVPRTTKVPRQCPKCWSTHWNQSKGKSK